MTKLSTFSSSLADRKQRVEKRTKLCPVSALFLANYDLKKVQLIAFGLLLPCFTVVEDSSQKSGWNGPTSCRSELQNPWRPWRACWWNILWNHNRVSLGSWTEKRTKTKKLMENLFIFTIFSLKKQCGLFWRWRRKSFHKKTAQMAAQSRTWKEKILIYNPTEELWSGASVSWSHRLDPGQSGLLISRWLILLHAEEYLLLVHSLSSFIWINLHLK